MDNANQENKRKHVEVEEFAPASKARLLIKVISNIVIRAAVVNHLKEDENRPAFPPSVCVAKSAAMYAFRDRDAGCSKRAGC